MGVVGITWVRSGEAGVRYLTSQFGCEKHEPVSYYLDGAEHGPMAVWLGAGVADLGFEVGQTVTEEDALIVLAHGCDPETYKILMAEAEEKIGAEGLKGEAAQELRDAVVDQARLGTAPYKFKSPEEKLTQWIKAETKRAGGIAPEAERVAAQKSIFDAGQVREARAYVDLTFSVQKSVSILHAAYLSEGRVEDAAKLMAAFHGAIDDALEYGQKEAGYSRSGRHSGGGADRPTTGRYVDAHGWIAARWDHHTSREGDPQLHAHVTVRNNVRYVDPTTGKESWLTLDGKALHAAQRGIAAVFERSLEERITRELLVEFKLRPDGKGREIVGINDDLLKEFSTRRGQIDAKLAQYVERFKELNGGAEPSKYQLSRMADAATLATRKPKDNELTLDQLVSKWTVEVQTGVSQDLAGALAAVEAEATAIRIEQETNGRGITAWDLNQRPELREEVIRAAVAKVEGERAHWSREDLMFALQKELPLLRMNGEASAPVLESLANEALARPLDFGTVQVDGFELHTPPAELQRADGRNIYRPHHDRQYSTIGTLTREELLVSRTRNGGDGVPRVDAAMVEDRIAERGLVAGQAEAVRGVLTDGRQVSVIVGPAGAGKTTVTANLREGWEQGVGGRVLGITPSSISAAELGEHVTGAVNSTIWLRAVAEGVASREQIERLTPRAGDLVVVDEAGMMSTAELHQIVEIAQARGAKVVMIGDPAQLSAVGAGGAFRLLVQDGNSYLLDEVYRFRDVNDMTKIREWEAEASLRIRAGDAGAVDQYLWRHRIEGGTAEAMTAKLAAAYLTDVAEGRQSVVLTGSNEQAEEVARAIRERLIESKRVLPGGVQIGKGQQQANTGDLIQARKNDHSRMDDQGKAVLNRYTYKVLDRHQDGSLTVARFLGYDENNDARLGGRLRLDPAYLNDSTMLAYAGTVHSAQGRTVQRGYVLLDELSSRELVYVGMTRGWEQNWAFVISQIPAGPETPNALNADPAALMREAIGRDRSERSATETLREAQDWIRSGPPNAGEWALIVEEHTTDRANALMSKLLSPENYARLQTEDPASLYRLARSAELRGHDFEAVLTQAVRRRELDTAETVAATLSWRITQQVLPNREPEYVPATDWASRTPQIDGRQGEYLLLIADTLDERQAVLGSRAVADPPQWALDRLGPVPEDAAERLEWERRAGAVEMYRETYGAPGDQSVIGRPPANGAVVQHAAWDAAYEALGPSDQERSLAGMSDRDLIDAVDTWHRHQEWAPRYVAEEMGTTSQSQASMMQDAELTRERARLEPDQDARDLLLQEAAGLESLAHEQSARMASLEEIQAARDLFWQRTSAVRENADAALGELDRRGIDIGEERRNRRTIREWWRDTVEDVRDRFRDHDQEQPEHEQLALFEVERDPLARFAEEEPERTAPEQVPAAEPATQAETADPHEQLELFELTPEQLQEQAELIEQREAEAAAAERETEPEAEPEQERERDQEKEREAEPERDAETRPQEIDVDAELDRARAAVLRLAQEDAPELAEAGPEFEAAEARGAELDPIEIGETSPELVEAEHGVSKLDMLEMMGGTERTPELDLSMEME